MSFLILVVILLVLVVLVPALKTYLRNRRISHYIDKLPGDKWYPIVGTSWQILRTDRKSLFELLMDRHKRLGPIIRSWYGTLPVVSIYKPEHAQVIFRSSSITRKGFFYKYLYGWLGEGLISGSGPKWKMHRRIITPSFHFNILDSYGEVFAEKGQMLAEYLEQFDGKGPFEITKDLTRVALDIIAEAAMGVKLHFLDRGDQKGLQYANAITEYGTTLYKRTFNLLYANDFLFSLTKVGKKCRDCSQIIHGFNTHVIRTRKEQLLQEKRDIFGTTDEYGCKKKISFLDLLLSYQQENGLTDKEVEDEVSTFMFAGFDTTVATVTYALLELGNHPEILERVHNELDDIFADDINRKVTPQDLHRMNYLEMVVNEVLRYYSFIPIIQRQLEEDIVIDGHTIPKGVVMGISLYDLHHDPEHYPEPFKFDPDRFLPENVAKRHPYAFVPFSAGPRNCLGQKFGMRNVKTLLTYVLRKFKVKCEEKPEDVKFFLELVLRPQNGIHISIESRR